jgi:hypothetical protein
MSKRPGVRVGAPVARPHAVWCIGTYDAAHAAESGSALPEVPILFSKTPNTVLGPNDDNRIPGGSTKTDWEVELPVVIGPRARYLKSGRCDTHCRTHGVQRRFRAGIPVGTPGVNGRRANAARASIQPARRWPPRTS